MEDNVEANALCTRREFARWLVKSNSFLETLVPPILAHNFAVDKLSEYENITPCGFY